MQSLPFATQTAERSSLPWSAQRLVNWMAIPNAGSDKTPVALYETPGLKTWTTIGGGPLRGLRRMGSYLYAVSGSELYKIDGNKTATLLGSGINGGQPVIMDDNGLQLAIQSDGWVWIATSTTFGRLNDADFPGASSFTVLDQYGIYTVPGTGEWGLTSLSDFTSVDALDFAQAERRPDNLVRGIVSGAELVLMGENTLEFWQNTGASPFPFERVQTAAGDTMGSGCAARLSVVPLDNSLYWLADDRTIRRLMGYTSKIVSPDPINELIGSLGDVSNAQAFPYYWRGRQFYAITFPTDDLTLVFDVATGLPFERRTGNVDTARWRGNCFEYAFGKHLIGDVRSGTIYELDQDTHADGDDEMVVSGVSPHFANNREWFILDRLEAEFESGVGLSSGQGSDPQVMLRISKDGGRTFGNPKTRSIGAQGVYANRAKWFGLGRMMQGCIELSVSDPVKRNLLGVWADIS